MQDPVTIARLMSRLRTEYGQAKIELMNRGMPAHVADQTAKSWVRNQAPVWAGEYANAYRDKGFNPTEDTLKVERVGLEWLRQQGPNALETSMKAARPESSIGAQRREWLSRIPVNLTSLTGDVKTLAPDKLQAMVEANQSDMRMQSLMDNANPVTVVPEASIDTPYAGDTLPQDAAVPRQSMSPLNDMAPAELGSVAPEGGLSSTQSSVLQGEGTTNISQPKTEDTQSWGAALAALGAAQQVIGNFYALKSQQTQLKQQALSLDFQQRMSQINARSAERQASDMLAAGRQQVMESTLRAGQVREGARATMAARGVRADVGSGAEVVASINLMKEIDRFTIDANAVRAAGAARMQGVNAANEGLLAGTSAFSLRQQAGALNPVAGAMPSLLTGVGQYYSQRAADRRWAAWAATQGLGE
jgi:hypothetical protein